jgi:hypothetical protein
MLLLGVKLAWSNGSNRMGCVILLHDDGSRTSLQYTAPIGQWPKQYSYNEWKAGSDKDLSAIWQLTLLPFILVHFTAIRVIEITCLGEHFCLALILNVSFFFADPEERM